MAGKILTKTAVGVAVVVAAYAAAGYLGVPAAAKWAVNSYLPTVLGDAQVSIGSVSFSPWTWELQVDDLKASSKSHPDQLSVNLKSLYVDLNCATLFSLAPVLDALRVDGLSAHLTDALLQDQLNSTAAKEPEKAQKSAASGDLPAFAVSNISITNSDLTFVNTRNKAKAEISEINFDLPVLSTMDSAGALSPMTPKLSLKVNGTLVQTSAKATENGGEVKLQVQNLDVAQVLRALPLKLPYVANSALASVDSTINFQLAKKGLPHIQAAGALTLNQVNVTQAQGKPFFSSPAIATQWSGVELLGPEVQKGSVTVSAANVDLRNDQGAALVKAATIAAAADGFYAKGTHFGFSASAVSANQLNVNDPTTGKALTSAAKVDLTSGTFAFADQLMTVKGVQVKANSLAVEVPAAEVTRLTVSALSTSVGALEVKGPKVKVDNARLSASGLDLRGPAGAQLLTAANTAAELASFDLALQTVAVNSLRVDQPVLWFTRSASAAKKSTAAAGKEAKTGASAPWHYSVREAALTNGRVEVTDQTIRPAGKLTVSNVNASVKNLSSDKGEATYTSSLNVAGGSIASSGKLALAPTIRVEGSTSVRGLQLASFNPWLTALAGTKFVNGNTSSEGKLHLTSTQPLKLSWEGQIDTNNMDVRHASTGVQYVAWNASQATGVQLTSVEPLALSIAKLHVQGLTQKNLNQVKQAVNILGFVGALTGNKKLSSVTNNNLVDSITLNHISYGPSGFKMGGNIGNGLESLLLGSLNSAFSKFK